MGVEDNKKTVQLIEEAFNRGDLDSLDQYYAAEFDNTQNAPPGMSGLQGAKASHGMTMQAFADRRTEIQEIVAEGNNVVVRVRTTGTNTGGVPWLGAPANGNAIDFEWISIYRFDDAGKVVAHYGLNDAYTLCVQLGVISPAMG